MPQLQRILVLWAANTDLASPVCAWSAYDPDSGENSTVGQESTPPFPSVCAALRAGWRILQYPIAIPAYPGMERDTGFLKHEFVLEKIQEYPHAK
jgi:hypothetical protein